MNIQQIKYVLAVVDLKNFQLAAEQCFVTQSTLSTMIAKLENEIGLKIFNRKTKPVSITADGESIISYMRRVDYEFDTMKNHIAELKGKVQGELKIAVIPTIAPYLLPLIANKFSNRLPDVNINVKEMTTSEIKQALKLRILDIGVLALPLEDHEIDEFEIYTEPFVVFDCTGNLRYENVTLEELDYSNICLLAEGHCLRTQVQKICDLSDIHTTQVNNFNFESGSMESLIKITKSRKGLTILPDLASLDLSNEDKQYLIPFKSPKPARIVGAVTQKFFIKKRLLNELIKVISEEVHPLLDHQKHQKHQKILKPLEK